MYIIAQIIFRLFSTPSSIKFGYIIYIPTFKLCLSYTINLNLYKQFL